MRFTSNPEFPNIQQFIHDRDENQCQDGGKGKAENNCPGKGPEKLNVITSKMDLWSQLGQQGTEIDVESKGQWYQTQYGGCCGEDDRGDPDLPCL